MQVFPGGRSLTLGWVVAVSAVLGYAQAARPQSQTSSAASSLSTQRAFLDQNCVGCHNQRAKTAGLMLDKMDITHVGENGEVWEKVVRKLRAGMMPPSGARRPDKQATDTFVGWLETELDRSAAAKLNPGAPALHRLNRTEYANVIRKHVFSPAPTFQPTTPENQFDGGIFFFSKGLTFTHYLEHLLPIFSKPLVFFSHLPFKTLYHKEFCSSFILHISP